MCKIALNFIFFVRVYVQASSRAKCPIRSLSSERIGHLASEDDVQDIFDLLNE